MSELDIADIEAGLARDAQVVEEASRRGRRSRTKGRVFERAVAKLLRAIWPDAKRGFQSRSGRDAPDVDGTPFHFECKHGARVNVRAAMRQALAATDGRPVVVVSREDRGDILVTMRMADWLAAMTPPQSIARATAPSAVIVSYGPGGSVDIREEP